jgi:peptidyl-prolyl cis-trans isomerase C
MNANLFPEVIVNGEKVDHTLVAAEAQNHEAPRGKPGIAWRKAANAVATRTLLLQEARRRGIEAAPIEVGPGRFETTEEALIRGLLEEAVNVRQPAEAEIRAEWARDPGRFRSPPLWEVSHILVGCDPSDGDEVARAGERALDIVSRVKAGGEAFAVVARQESDCPSRGSGGALGQLGPGHTVPEFEAALRLLADGEVTAHPVLTRHGWHVIRMDACAEGAVLPFAAVRDKVAAAMEKVAWSRAARAFVADLVAASEISGADFRPV